MKTFPVSAFRFLALSLLAFQFLVSPVLSQETADSYDPSDPAIGFNLISYQSNNQQALAEYFTAIDELASINADHVNLVVFRRVGADGKVDFSTGPNLFTIYRAARRAKQKNLKVIITPIFETEEESAWRGAWNPDGLARSNFIRSYSSFVQTLAIISNWVDADTLNIGSELVAFVNQPSNKGYLNWLVRRCGAIFDGELGYNANWDNFTSPLVKEIFWDHRRIERISVSMYPYKRLASVEEADLSDVNPVEFAQQVTKRWRALVTTGLLPYALTLKDNQGMPVVIGEFGAVPFNRCAATPADFQPSAQVDVKEQEAVIMGLIRGVDQLGPVVPKITIWQWGIGDMSDRFGLNPFHESPQQATALEVLRFMQTAEAPAIQELPFDPANL